MVAITPQRVCTDPALVDDPSSVRNNDPSAKCYSSENCASGCAGYGRICPCAARSAGTAAARAVQKLQTNSQIFHETPTLRCLKEKDLVMGKKLGEGGFSVVYKATLGGQEVAVKHLKRRVMVEPKVFELGAADLAVEANFLQQLDHPHIVKLHGVTEGSVQTNFAKAKERGFFIVIDQLHGTLEKKIEQWKEEVERSQGNIIYRRSHEYKEKRKAALNQRLRIALQIAEAMQYLHDQNVVYRDLKPDNVGFDVDGNVKLFDFGLAKELKEKNKVDNDKYKMTGNTGSRRYMAPEVAKEQPYGVPVDVFSFGILLWELCAMEKPFHGYSANKHMMQVVMKHERPSLDTSSTSWFPVNLHWLLQKCWSSDAASRPSFVAIQKVLNDVIDGKTSIPGAGNDAPRSPKRAGYMKQPSLEAPAGGFASMNPAAKKGRAKTWGFSRRQKSAGKSP